MFLKYSGEKHDQGFFNYFLLFTGLTGGSFLPLHFSSVHACVRYLTETINTVSSELVYFNISQVRMTKITIRGQEYAQNDPRRKKLFDGSEVSWQRKLLPVRKQHWIPGKHILMLQSWIALLLFI